MSFYIQPAKLVDCRQHGADSPAELFIVEGDSASKAVARARDPSRQAVLPMQGKPINAWKASRRTIDANDLLTVLIDALGGGWDQQFDVTRIRYGRVVLLFDPDADGIHCGALMMMFFYRWMPALIESQKLSVIRAPLFEITSAQHSDTVHALNEEHLHRLRHALNDKGIDHQIRRFRGLANLDGSTLAKTCLQPDSRYETVIGIEDAEAAIKVFGGRKL